MGSSRQARAGIPISVKLILVSTLVVAAAVGGATWFGQRTISELTQLQIAARRDSGMRAITRESELVVLTVAGTITQPFVNTQIEDVKLLIKEAMDEDKASGDNRVQWLAVVDGAGNVVVSTDGAPSGDELAKLQERLATGIKRGAVSHAQVGKPTDWVYGVPINYPTQVGAVRMGVSTESLERELAASISQAEQRATEARNRVWLVSLVVLAIGVVLAALQGVQLARPIKMLTYHAEQIAAGHLDVRAATNRGDELGVLAVTFNLMAEEIQALLYEQGKKASLEKEMELARQVQQAMLPPDTLDHHGHLKVVGYCMPASSCGGDWWTYRKLPSGKLLLVLGDATGHGIHSAMIAATARGAVEALATLDERAMTPEQVLRAIDASIRQVGDHNVLMTAFAAMFDSASGMLSYANAGQNFPYVMKLGTTRVIEAASIIAASGNPLGDRNIPVEIRRGQLQLRPGDLFVCFTDGVVERSNPSGKLFGDRRLRGTLTGQAVPDGNALVGLRDRLVSELDAYAEGSVAEDDITFVLCQFDPEARPEVAGRGAA
ncbi:MAG: PP2C family protein-serine/threonine phosphatase [Kofleriaceae bacterium]